MQEIIHPETDHSESVNCTQSILRAKYLDKPPSPKSQHLTVPSLLWLQESSIISPKNKSMGKP